MEQLKFLIKIFFLSILVLSFSKLSAASQNNNNGFDNDMNGMNGVKCTSLDLNIFDGDDEQDTYNNHGYSRGDMAFLFTAQYDPNTEEVVNGRIAKVLRIQANDDTDCYLLAVINTDNGDLLVNLGPVWLADEKQMVIREGDTAQVKGSKLRANGRWVMVASQIKTNNKEMQFRNQNGNADWGMPKAQKNANSRGHGRQSGSSYSEVPAAPGYNSSRSRPWGLSNPSPSIYIETEIPTQTSANEAN